MIQFTPEQEEMGLIRVDSEKGRELGLTSDRFTEDSYLWLKDGTLHLSWVFAKEEHKGFLLNVLNNAKEKGFDMVAVPVSQRMCEILTKFGFNESEDNSEIWVYKNNSKRKL